MKTLIFSTSLTVFILYACGNHEHRGSSSSKMSFKELQLTIISPYGCYQEITVVSDGHAILKSGLKKGSIADVDVRLGTLFSQDSFSLVGEQSLVEINFRIRKILDTANIRGGHKDDAYRCKLVIDGQLKIDAFGVAPDIHELLKYLFKYLPLSNDKCEFFELMRKYLA